MSRVGSSPTCSAGRLPPKAPSLATRFDTGVQGGTFVAISPRQSAEDEVLFIVGVEDVEATLARAEQVGGSIVQPAQHVPGTSFGVFADAQGPEWG
jgi:predicted enzyme related to lactoylglutathione lyase